ncbi:MAG: hypothetical protein J5849_04365, partial [Clostridia bacterium]|nr:hypothetical protein [Clostridia bacterium]
MKTESPTRAARRHAREAKELLRWERESLKKPLIHGFWFLLIILTVIYIADEISSNMNGVMKPYMIFDL